MQFRKRLAVRRTKQRINELFETLMPPLVVREVLSMSIGMTDRHHQFECATIAQSDLCGFTQLASTREPEEVFVFINEIFGMFDDLTDQYGIYKVETVGDAYIAGQAEPPLSATNS